MLIAMSQNGCDFCFLFGGDMPGMIEWYVREIGDRGVIGEIGY